MKKLPALLVSLLFYNLNLFAQDPCTNITPITCSDMVTFSQSGAGDINYPNNIGGCNTSTELGGKEQIYLITPPMPNPPWTTGYVINIISATGGYVQYLWKPYGTDCNEQGWTCLGRTDTAGFLPYDGPSQDMPIYLLVNAETTEATTQIFEMGCFLSNQDFNQQNICTISPNPVKSIVNINVPNGVAIEKVIVSDLSGKKLIEQTQSTSQIGIEQLAQGIYVLEAYAGDKKFHNKFVKE